MPENLESMRRLVVGGQAGEHGHALKSSDNIHLAWIFWPSRASLAIAWAIHRWARAHVHNVCMFLSSDRKQMPLTLDIHQIFIVNSFLEHHVQTLSQISMQHFMTEPMKEWAVSRRTLWSRSSALWESFRITVSSWAPVTKPNAPPAGSSKFSLLCSFCVWSKPFDTAHCGESERRALTSKSFLWRERAGPVLLQIDGEVFNLKQLQTNLEN